MYRCIKLYIVVLTIIGLTITCSRKSQQEVQLHKYLNKELRLNIFPSVINQQKIQSYNEFRNKYKYISVVFLKKGCKPCDSKIAEWQRRMEIISDFKNYSVLFIFQGYNYNEISKLNAITSFAFIIDIHCRYLIYNRDIPEWILDNSVLIDAKNRIKLIGDPFSTHEKTKELYSIIKKID